MADQKDVVRERDVRVKKRPQNEASNNGSRAYQRRPHSLNRSSYPANSTMSWNHYTSIVLPSFELNRANSISRITVLAFSGFTGTSFCPNKALANWL